MLDGILPADPDHVPAEYSLIASLRSGGSVGFVFSTGSITFCGSLPWNNFNNNIATMLENVVLRMNDGKLAERSRHRPQALRPATTQEAEPGIAP